MSERIERQIAENRKRLEKGGYVPVTPIGPPPQGEPLFAAQGQASTVAATPASQAQPQTQAAPATPYQQGSQAI